MRYREFGIEAPDYEPMTFYSSDSGEEDPAAFLSSLHGDYDAAVPAGSPYVGQTAPVEESTV
jgi:DNA-directed RNA polymerase subunit beta'